MNQFFSCGQVLLIWGKNAYSGGVKKKKRSMFRGVDLTKSMFRGCRFNKKHVQGVEQVLLCNIFSYYVQIRLFSFTGSKLKESDSGISTL